MADQKKNGRFQLILLMAVFFGPVILAWYLYDSGTFFSSGPSTAHGMLITPVKLAEDANLSVSREEQDSPYPGRWTLALALEGSCDELCEKLLYETRQVRVALGKEDRRVQRIVFLTSDTPLDATVHKKHPGLQIITPDNKLSRDFLQAIGPYGTRNVYLIDPLGNLIMRFKPDTGMKGMHKDLKRLLSISHIG